MKWCASCLLGWVAGCGVAAGAVLTGTASSPAGLQSVVDEFRGLVSAGGGNNGVGGSFADGRREVGWDVASLDLVQVPAAMPGNFFNGSSPRGLVLATPGSLRVSGRAASGSRDVLFSTLNPGAANALQAFSPERLLALYGATVVEASFFLPATPAQPGVVRGFGAVFADVGVVGASRLEAFGLGGDLLGAVDVPAAAGGLSFAGLWFDGGERIASVRLTVGQAGMENTSGLLDVVALDEFIYGEPQPIPEPGSVLLLVLTGAALQIAGGRRAASLRLRCRGAR